MNKNLEIIFARRSIRKYKKRQVIPQTAIEFILNAGMCAPSARNKKPWQFIVCQNPQTLDILSERHPYAQMLKDASLAILVCGDKSLDDNESYLLQNCAAAAQNILLATHASELGAVWLGIHPREERILMCKEIFELPDFILPIALISIGIPNEEKPKNNRFDETKVKWEKWK
jgi:nitroreductase